MCSVEQEQRRLAEENQARLFYFISHHVFEMNELLKCSICFDIFEKPTTIFHCFHVFCEDCIRTYLDYSTIKEPPCPVCQKPIPRSDLRSNDFLAKVAKFLKFVRGRFDTTLGCNVLKPPSFQTILAKLKENNNKKELLMRVDGVQSSDVQAADYSLILKARKILVGPNNKIISTVKELPPLPSVNFRDGSVKTPTSHRRATSVNKNQNAPSSTNKDPFDIVKESPVENPFFKGNRLNLVTKTYTAHKHPKQTPNRANTKFVDKIIQFEDNSNKLKIIQWLNDSRNRFDCVPQTQENNVPESQLQSQFDMPSASQRHKHKAVTTNIPSISQINNHKVEQSKIRQRSEMITRLSRTDSLAKAGEHTIGNRRTRSLENHADVLRPNLKLKRHSISVDERADLHAAIEQFNSEDEVIFNGILENAGDTTAIVNLIEEECLQSIENEVLQRTKQNKRRVCSKRGKKAADESSAPKRSRRLSRSSKLQQATKETHRRLSKDKDTSGWDRMKEIKKAIRKVEIKPGKLTVTGVSRCSSTVTTSSKDIEGVNVTSHAGTAENRRSRKKLPSKGEPVVILEEINVGNSTSDDVEVESNDEGRRCAYDLDALESYFSKNLNRLADNGLLIDNTKTPQKEVRNFKSLNTNKPKGNETNLAENNSCEKQLPSDTKTKNTKNDSSNNLSLLTHKFDKKRSESKDDESKNCSNQVAEAKDKESSSVTSYKVKKKSKNDKFKGPLSKTAKSDTSSVISYKLEKEKSKLDADKSQNSFSQVVEATEKPSTSTATPRSRKRLFDDNESNSGVNQIEKRKDKLTTFSCLDIPDKSLADDESKRIEKEKLPSTCTNNYLKETSKVEDAKSENNSSCTVKEKLKFLPHKYVEGILELVDKSENNSIQADITSKNNSKVLQSHNTASLDKNNIGNFDDDFFTKPTQVIAGEQQRRDNPDDDADEIFAMPTQIITISNSEESNKLPLQDESLETILKHKIRSLNDILNAPNFVAEIKNILKDIEQTISNENSQHKPMPDGLMKDMQVQTDTPKEVSSLFSHDATTQTVFPEEKIQHVAIQTDSCDSSRGFRISLTDMFYTRPVANAEMQTDAMMCPKCSFVFENKSKTPRLSGAPKITSLGLTKDHYTIKSLSEKYVLSESFDNIDFETQEVIRGKQIKGSLSSLKGSGVAQNCTDIVNEQNKENKQNIVDYKVPTTSAKKLNDPGVGQKSELATTGGLSSQTCNKTQNKRTFKRIRKPSSDSDSDGDRLPRNVKRNKFVQDDLSLHFASELQKEISQPGKTTEGDGLTFSEGSQGIDYGEYLQNVLKKCDEEVLCKRPTPAEKTAMKPPAKRSKTQDIIKECEMIIQEACSEVIKIENTENFSNNLHNSARQRDFLEPTKLTLAALEEEFQHDFNDDKDDTKKLEEFCNNAQPAEVSSSVKNHVNKNDNSEKKKEARNKFSESLFGSADDFSESTNNPISSQHVGANHKDVGKHVNGNENKEIKLGNKKEKMEVKQANNKQLHQSCLDELIEVFNEFDSSFEDEVNTEVESINQSVIENNTSIVTENRVSHVQPENLNNGNNKIRILQDIVIAKNNIAVNQGANSAAANITDFKKSNAKSVIDLISDDASDESDDMFLFDLDVVETTPQKNKPVPVEKLSFISQAYYNPAEGMVLPPIVDESPDIVSSLDPPPLTCLNEVFKPPPEFEDPATEKTLITNDNNDKVSPTATENKKDQKNNDADIIHSEVQDEMNRNMPPSSSLTPDLVFPQSNQLDRLMMNKKEPFVTSTPYMEESQIIPLRSLNLSPISMGEPNKVTINPILAAQNSKYSPLTIVKSKTPPPQKPVLLTNTPKQKSILNYVRPNENSNTSFTKTDHCSQWSQKSVKDLSSQSNKKPCVACTRMSKEQLLAITSLANKKLISYANAFSTAVTHMIVDVNQQNCVKDHTMKFVSAVAAGIWVVSFSWVKACLTQGRLLPEEPFEALDMSGVAGPKKSRLTRANKPLLQGYKIHAAPPFMSTTQKEVENVVTLLGAEVVPRPDDLLSRNGKICLIITEVKGSQDFELYEMWMEMLKVVTVDLEWLSRSVGQYEKLSLRPFALCSEDSICDLGYPAELIAEMPLSFSHNTVNTA